MKKILLAVAILAMGISTVKAQGLKFGVKGGMNYACFRTEIDQEDSNARIAYQVGVAAEMKVSSTIGVQGEVLYSAQGHQPSENFTLKHDYINIPLSVKYYLGDMVSLEVGPQIGFIVNAKMDHDSGKNNSGVLGDITNKIGSLVNENYKESVNTVDMGLNLGAAFHVTDNIALGARYTYSLSDIYKEGTLYNNSLVNWEAKNSNIQLSLAYYFN